MAGSETHQNDVPDMLITVAALRSSKGEDTADFGDFVSNEEEELDLEEVVEPWHKYDIKETSRVFYPICVGELLNERYLVEHKIGSGGFSTVWMGCDLQNKRNLALKVMSLGEWGERKIKFPLKGPCLYPVILETMPMATRMSAAQQLLKALENLHNAGIVHRDLNERNCISAKYEAFGRPLKQPIPFVELWKRGELVGPIKIPEELRTEDFYLGDFDRLHGKDPSFACDMWSYMVIFAELYLGHTPFPTWLKGGIITGIVRCLGPLPEQWRSLYPDPGGLQVDSWYDQSNKPDPNHDLASTIARFRPDADPIEREHVHSIMGKVFNACPEKRLTAAQLLQDPSFRAIIDKYGC
ncbi:hypothetical protein ASPWEDRAFT_62274 [Aspergillus wentii DTO 134E9]|uniref:Protein kinase domain-containing protein n=1 Tax=Aspergillus wentii DTO 134E9 TaxID=1073089 RepID=A0A1L9R7K5_ASPWE|nr:uncharacterized protein ASPWEDRAFT_62274 [Aspergillus wentii DTO 134E9]OJJ30902.1 hypothetical protein ASPWEDRAFT_62274 [Aspergillus wentii DTO 134E9]